MWVTWDEAMQEEDQVAGTPVGVIWCCQWLQVDMLGF